MHRYAFAGSSRGGRGGGLDERFLASTKGVLMPHFALRLIRFIRSAPGRVRQRVAMLCAGPTRDAGMSTAEYAIGTIAACAFAALLYKVVTSTQILNLLTGLVSRALHTPF